MPRLCLIVLSGLLLMLFQPGARPLTAGTSVSQHATLTPSDIDDAIRWGESGKASPYALRWKSNRGADDGVVIGAVYTPFVRVALAAQAAFDAGHGVAREDIAPDSLEPVIYIAFRWYCCLDLDHGTSIETWNPREPFVDYGVAMPGTPMFKRFQLTRPLWVRRDLSMLTPVGGPPYPDVVLVAGYPLSAVSQPGDFIIYRQTTNPVSGNPGTDMLVGHVSATNVQNWR